MFGKENMQIEKNRWIRDRIDWVRVWYDCVLDVFYVRIIALEKRRIEFYARIMLYYRNYSGFLARETFFCRFQRI